MRVGTLLVKRDPKNLTQEFSKADRGGRILVDTGRNGYSATFAAAYAVRAEARRAGFRAVHVGGARKRRGRPADIHTANDGRAHRRRRRPVVGHAQTQALAATSDGKAAKATRTLKGPRYGCRFRSAAISRSLP